MGFNVGDLVRVNCPGSTKHGEETTVIGPAKGGRALCPDGSVVYEICFPVDFPTTDVPWAFRGDELIPLYDGREPCSWEDCVWRPTELVC